MESVIITARKDNFKENNLIKGFLTKVGQTTGVLNSLVSLEGELNKFNDSIKGQIFFKPSFIEGVIITQDTLIGQLNSIFNIEGIIEVPQKQKVNNNCDYDFYSGSVNITPSFTKQILNTKNKILKENMKVYQIQTYEVSNDSGTTFII